MSNASIPLRPSAGRTEYFCPHKKVVLHTHACPLGAHPFLRIFVWSSTPALLMKTRCWGSYWAISTCHVALSSSFCSKASFAMPLYEWSIWLSICEIVEIIFRMKRNLGTLQNIWHHHSSLHRDGSENQKWYRMTITQAISPKVKMHLNHLGKALSDTDLSNYDWQGVTSRMPLTVYLSTAFSPSDWSFEFSCMREECQTLELALSCSWAVWAKAHEF